MGSKITSIRQKKLSSWRERSVQQNLLIFVRVGGHNDIPTASKRPALCHAFRLTGNVGITAATQVYAKVAGIWVEWFPMLENPVKTQISVFTWTDAIDHGTEMTATRDGVRGKEKLDVPSSFYGLRQ
ncbi:putative dimethyl sulfoxide reductase, olydopterin dinucleotide binding subunit [Escherichia coli]|uniref:Putative dimethyl sulfoxide reductase, olydopterin dinucleotide binding subunit n=1 Tax=Escherichia coli TaxID=562 RepID=A0A376RIW3_ECOLX|nr:putative dimethyl sulfoxide reductase, olydopterin dinucleotide binding subunit [Escherichia coli]